MPAKILMRSLEANHDLKWDENMLGWMKWKKDRFLVVSSFFAKSNEARQKGRYSMLLSETLIGE
jgi:hypothetical protein